MNSEFGFGKVVEESFDGAIQKVTAELEKEGFGVLSDIDVAAKMKAKLDKDIHESRKRIARMEKHFVEFAKLIEE